MAEHRRLVVAFMAAALSSFAAESTAMRLYCSPFRNVTWQTIAAPTVALRLNWPKGATDAELKIVSAQGKTVLSQQVAAGAETYDWTVFTGDAPPADDCFSVTVTYSTGDVETAVLALETGTFSPITAHVADSEKSFARTAGGRAVAYDAAWLGQGAGMVSLASVFQATGAETVLSAGPSKDGYFRWSPADGGGHAGRYDLSLSCGARAITGFACYERAGMCVLVR